MKQTKYTVFFSLAASTRAVFSAAVPVVAAAFTPATLAHAHHSYAMFDGTKVLTIRGSVAKLEWMNPHVFVWIHVPNPEAPGKYDLYAFENGSPHVLSEHGWTSATLQIGEKVVIDYWPLKDGRHGGHFLRAIHADGRISSGAGGPNASTSGSFAPDARPAKQDTQPP